MTAVLAGLVCLLLGLSVSLVIVRRSRTRWLLAGQHQAELTHGGWHPAVLGGSWNAPEPRSRRRSPDHQMTARNMPPQIQRPGFYTQR